MSGLFVILIPAGILAALIFFRWARTLALFLAAALVIWFVIHMSHARAEAPGPLGSTVLRSAQ